MAKRCFYCIHKLDPSFKDIENLEKFLTPRKKILPADKSNLCAKHQRKITKQIKHARFLALIPYTSLQNQRKRSMQGG